MVSQAILDEVKAIIDLGARIGVDLTGFDEQLQLMLEEKRKVSAKVTMTHKSKIKLENVKKQERMENVKKQERMENVKKQERNWLDLPRDVTANILYRVGVIDILENAQKVCTAWRHICKDPSIWRVLDVENFWDPCGRPPVREICKNAVDRSQGQLVELTICDVCKFELIMYIAERSSQLRRLEITYCYGALHDSWYEFADKFALLEELSLQMTDFSEEDIISVGRCCPLLKTLKIIQRRDEYIDDHMYAEYMHDDDDMYDEYIFDDTALAIGKNLPKLTNLVLIGDSMTNIGLQAILDGCRLLESLDLRRCSHIDLKGDLGKRCSKQIKNLPNDPIAKKLRTATIEPKVYRQEEESDEEEEEDDEDDDDDNYYGYSLDDDGDFKFHGCSKDDYVKYGYISD